MANLAFITHPVFLKHDTGPGHPERPDRLVSITEAFEHSHLKNKVEMVQPIRATPEQVSLVHTDAYIRFVTEAIHNGSHILDFGDTVVCSDSLDAAYYACGAGIRGVDLLAEGKYSRVFCAVRPPGHHAEPAHALGFCIFNNAAVAARYAQRTGVAEKILIIDWDVHHGNGTQHTFEQDAAVFYYSLHRYPFYPGTGLESECGLGAGEGFTLNRPLKAGSDDTVYLQSFAADLAEIERKIKPDLIILSNGYDAHREDPLGGMMMTDTGYWKMTEMISRFAWHNCEGRILSILEGGYNLEVLARCVLNHLDCMIKH
jgi:acetoin utilization deacetylase AcuC-like enzyme